MHAKNPTLQMRRPSNAKTVLASPSLAPGQTYFCTADNAKRAPRRNAEAFRTIAPNSRAGRREHATATHAKLHLAKADTFSKTMHARNARRARRLAATNASIQKPTRRTADRAEKRVPLPNLPALLPSLVRMGHANPFHANQTIIFRDHHASKAMSTIAARRGKSVIFQIMPLTFIASVTYAYRQHANRDTTLF